MANTLTRDATAVLRDYTDWTA
jgi:hypothetical protein